MLSELNSLSLSLLALLLLLSGFFSSSETAFMGIQRVRLHHLVSVGSRRARVVEGLVGRPGPLLATILVGNNLANVAFTVLITVLVQSRVPPELAIPTATGIATVLLLLLGEIVPKTAAVHRAERLALVYAHPMRLLVTLLTPLTLPLARLLPQKRGGVSTSEEELQTLVASGHEEGAIEPHEAELVQKILHFGDKLAREVMVPRPEVVWVQEGMTLREFLDLYLKASFTRFPVYRDTYDEVVGILSIKDVLRARADGSISENSVITDLVRPPLFTPETKRLGPLFREMREARSQVALVVDEYGSISGMATLQRFIEEIVGPVGEGTARRETVRTITQGVFQVDGAMTISDANAQLGLDLPQGDYQTVAGFVLTLLGHVPHEGEHVLYNSLYVLVDRMRGAKIERLVISRRG